MGAMHAAADGGAEGAASRVRAVSTGDRARARRPSTPPARSPRGGTEPSHAKKSKDDPTTALSKDGHDTFTSRGGTLRGSHRSHTQSRAALLRAKEQQDAAGRLIIVLAVALRPRRGPRRTRAKVLEVLLHCVASANDRREQSSGLAGPAPTSERRFQVSSSSSSPRENVGSDVGMGIQRSCAPACQPTGVPVRLLGLRWLGKAERRGRLPSLCVDQPEEDGRAGVVRNILLAWVSAAAGGRPLRGARLCCLPDTSADTAAERGDRPAWLPTRTCPPTPTARRPRP